MTKDNPQVLEIVLAPHPILRQKAKPVKKINRKIKQLLDQMAVTMYDAEGVGLAAPQVAVPLRVIVVDVGDGLVELINPEIISKEGSEVGWEGCLSIPGYLGEVERAKQIHITGLDRNGRRVYLDAADFFARALQHEVDHLDGILYTDKAKRVVEIPPESRLRILFMGTPDFAAMILDHLLAHGCHPVAVVTQPDRPRGRGKKLQPSAVKKLAEEKGLPVWQPEDLESPEFLQQVEELDLDVIITVAYGKKLPDSILETPALASINVHASLLPRYRGAAPIQRALLAGERETGITIMHMTSRMDAGDIILQKKLDIEPEDHAGRLHDRLANLGGEALIEALRLLATGKAERIPQDDAQASYAARIQPQEEWIDWHRPADAIVNQIRAFTPWPGAKTRLGDKIIQICEARVADYTAPAPAPGSITITKDRELTVACGDGFVRITRLKPSGGKEMTAVEYLNGHPLSEGEQFA